MTALSLLYLSIGVAIASGSQASCGLKLHHLAPHTDIKPPFTTSKAPACQGEARLNHQSSTRPLQFRHPRTQFAGFTQSHQNGWLCLLFLAGVTLIASISLWMSKSLAHLSTAQWRLASFGYLSEEWSGEGAMEDRLSSTTALSDWRQFRADMVQAHALHKVCLEDACGANLSLLRNQAPALAAKPIWAHLLAQPEPGCLMLAQPGANEGLLDEAVVLLLKYSDAGAMGLVINRPSRRKLDKVLPVSGSVVNSTPLYVGGTDGAVFMVLHGSIGLEGSQEIIPGVFVGGLLPMELSDGELIPLKECKLFVGYMSWPANQLEKECSEGKWWPVAASPSIILKHAHQLPKPLWAEIMDLCGGELAQASKQRPGDAL